MRRLTIRDFLTLAFILAGTVPLVLFTGAFWAVLRGHLDDDIGSATRGSLRAVAVQTSALVLQEPRRLLPAVLLLSDISPERQYLEEILRAASVPRPEIIEMAFLSGNGTVEAVYPGRVLEPGAPYPSRIDHSHGIVKYSRPFAFDGGHPAVIEARYETQRRTAVALIGLGDLSSKLVLSLHSSRDRVGVVDDEGRYLLCSDPSRVGTVAESAGAAIGSSPLLSREPDGDFYVLSEDIPGSEWRVLYHRSRAEADGPADAYFRLVLAMGALGIVGAGGFALGIWRTVRKPFQELVSGIRSFEAGNYGQRLRAASFDAEFAAIAEAFNEMAASIERRDREVRTAERRAAAALAEKTQLIQEIYHRVKNNQQLVVSILRMQADGASTPEERESLRTAQDRMYAMALAHDLVYEAKDLAVIEIGDFVRRLLSNYLQSAGPRTRRVEFEGEGIEVSLERAIPFALALNEMLAAVLRESESAAEEPPVRISMRKAAGASGTGEAEVVVSTSISPTQGDILVHEFALNALLVQTLAGQLGGTGRWFSAADGGAVRAELRFPI